MSGPKQTVLALKINGLFTDPNSFSEVPEGVTLGLAANVVLDRDSVLQSRRGFPQYGIAPNIGDTSTNYTLRSIFDFKDTLIIHNANGVLSYDANNDGSVWTTFPGAFYAPGNTSADRISSFQSNKNMYLATNGGIYKMTSASTAPVLAGAPAGLGGSGVATGVVGFMPDNTNVAYRIVWGYRDANENLILGSPSDRIVVSNTLGNEANVDLTFLIPDEITTDWFYQVYRSATSAGINDEPDDELQLVQDVPVTALEVSAGQVTFEDQTPDNLRGVIIYTAPSIAPQGILSGNNRPPFAKASCVFNNISFYGNTRNTHALTFTLISAGSPNGIQIGDTITVTDGFTPFVITGAAAENVGSSEFLVQTSLTPAENIAETAQSIVNVVNSVVGNVLVVAYYESGFDELPGRILFERLSLSPNPFYVRSSRGDSFRPVLPALVDNYNNTSRNENNQNRVYFSKVQQPEAVPILQYFDIGSAEEPILSLVPLRDGVIVIKTDGVYRISGSTVDSLSVAAIDRTVKILAQHSVAVLSNKVYFFSTQGIVAVSDTGAEIVSRPIETDLLELSSSLYPNFSDITFAVGYESDRKYILWTVTTASDEIGTQAFVYNTLTGAWTRWTKNASAGIVKQDDDKLYLCGTAANEVLHYVFQERKNFNLSDFADEQYTIDVTGASGLTLTVDDTSLLVTGYTIQQVVASSLITEIVDSTTIRVASLENWDIGPATVYRPIDQYFRTNQFDAGNPNKMKHWADCSIIYRATTFDTMQIGFDADTTNETRTVTLTAPPGTGGWGTFAWGTLPWGLGAAARARLRTSVPKQAMRSNWISISGSLSESFTDMSIAGISMTLSDMSSRQKSASR